MRLRRLPVTLGVSFPLLALAVGAQAQLQPIVDQYVIQAGVEVMDGPGTAGLAATCESRMGRSPTGMQSARVETMLPDGSKLELWVELGSCHRLAVLEDRWVVNADVRAASRIRATDQKRVLSWHQQGTFILPANGQIPLGSMELACADGKMRSLKITLGARKLAEGQ